MQCNKPNYVYSWKINKIAYRFLQKQSGNYISPKSKLKARIIYANATPLTFFSCIFQPGIYHLIWSQNRDLKLSREMYTFYFWSVLYPESANWIVDIESSI